MPTGAKKTESSGKGSAMRGALARRYYQPLSGRAATGDRLCIKIRKSASDKRSPDTT